MNHLEGTRNRNHRRGYKPKVFLFCRHPLAQEQFTRLLKHGEFDVALQRDLQLADGAASALDSAVDAVDNEAPSLWVIDGNESTAALEFLHTLQTQRRAVHLLVLLPALDELLTSRLLRLGVKGLLTYQQAPRELCRAAAQVAAGGYWVPRELLSRFVESVLPELQGCKSIETDVEISRREREVLDLLLANLCNKEIAGKLFVSERTIKFHVSNLLAKFGVLRRTDLIVLWMQRNAAFSWLAQENGRTIPAPIN